MAEELPSHLELSRVNHIEAYRVEDDWSKDQLNQSNITRRDVAKLKSGIVGFEHDVEWKTVLSRSWQSTEASKGGNDHVSKDTDLPPWTGLSLVG